MAKVITTVNTVMTTDAEFRTWGSAVSAALLAAGLTQTSDTGQINWTTVNKPTAANTTAGYEMWRFNDALQSTAPVYVRITYGSANQASGNNPGLCLNVANSTNGAGVLTGKITHTAGGLTDWYRLSYSSSQTSTAVSSPLTISYNGGHLAFIHGSVLTGGAPYVGTSGEFFVSRTVSPTTGADNGDGLGIVYGPTSTAMVPNYRSIDYIAAGTTTAAALTNSSVISSAGSHNTMNEAFVYPLYIQTGNGPRMLGGLLACGVPNVITVNTLSHGGTFSCAIVSGGTSRTYYTWASNVAPYQLWVNGLVTGGTDSLSISNMNGYYGTCFVWE